MPFDIMYKQPTSEAVRFISEFARKTGDYASLSAVDIRVLAVTYDYASLSAVDIRVLAV